MSSMSDEYVTKVLSSLKKYIRSGAIHSSVGETFDYYLGKNSLDSDHEAFLEYLESEYIANACHKLKEEDVIKIGVYSLLDGLPPSSLKGRPPTLSALLDEHAFQGGNTATYDFYLGERRTREEEQEFRQRLFFVKSIFDQAVNEIRAHAVAEYMLGPLYEEEEDDDEEEDEDDTQVEQSDDDMVIDDDDDDDGGDGDDDRVHTKDKHSNRRKYDEDEDDIQLQSDSSEDSSEDERSQSHHSKTKSSKNSSKSEKSKSHHRSSHRNHGNQRDIYRHSDVSDDGSGDSDSEVENERNYRSSKHQKHSSSKQSKKPTQSSSSSRKGKY